MATVLPVEIIQERVALLKERSSTVKRKLQDDLESEIERVLESFPEPLRNLTLGEFLALLSLSSEQDENTTLPNKRKKTILGLPAEEMQRMTLNFEDPGRRMTRSMAARLRKESIARRESGIIPSVPATPRLFPGLPETPAAVRQQLKQHSNDQPHPVRIAGSTIRSTKMISQTPATKLHATQRKAINPAVQNLIHMELSDGKVVDLDLTKSPGSVFTGIGTEKAGEVKEWLSQYASAFTSFLKRLGGT